MKRRSFLIGGLAALFAAPAIVRAASLMRVSAVPSPEFVVNDLLARAYQRYSISYSDWRGTFSPRLESVTIVRHVSSEIGSRVQASLW